MTSSRLQTVPPSFVVSSGHNLGARSEFLRSAVADKEALKLSESMGWLAAQTETVVGALKSNAEPAVVAEMLVDLLTQLRQHRRLVMQLHMVWRELYEYPAYLAALNQCRVMVGQWVMQIRQPGARFPAAHEFEAVAWRMLGEGALLIDVYEQTRSRERGVGRAENATLLSRLRTWLRKKRG